MSYKLLASGVQRIEDGACIPADLGNVDWLKYQDFVAAGGATLPLDKPTQRQVVLDQLAEIDRLAGAVRWIREFALGTNAGFNAVRDALLPSLPSAGSGMLTLQQIEARAIALRVQLATTK